MHKKNKYKTLFKGGAVKDFPEHVSQALHKFELVRVQLWSLLTSWSAMHDSVANEALRIAEMGILVEKSVETMLDENTLSLKFFARGTQKEAERIKELATELAVMLEELANFKKKGVEETEKMFLSLERTAKNVAISKKKKKIEAEMEEVGFLSSCDIIVEKATKVGNKWAKLSFMVVEWYLTAKMSASRETYTILRAEKTDLPAPCFKANNTKTYTDSGIELEEVDVDVTLIEPQQATLIDFSVVHTASQITYSPSTNRSRAQSTKSPLHSPRKK